MRHYQICVKNNCPHIEGIGDVLRTDIAVCEAVHDYCNEQCKNQPPPPPPPPKKPKKPHACRPTPKSSSLRTTDWKSLSAGLRIQQESLLQQLDLIFAQIQGIISPYVTSSAPWPAAVRAQVSQLSANANSVAGGDAAGYLRDYLLRTEIERAANGTQEEPDGNAPDYPVLYLAQVLRPNGIFELRGKTEPYGQYSLFIPRDGTLLSVRFYDPQTKTFDIIYPRRRPDAPWRLPSFTLLPLAKDAPDSDHDGLPDAVELVYGTDPFNPDTGNKGITDGAAVELGLDPLGGILEQTGIVGTAKSVGSAVDICTSHHLAIVAELDKGVSVFDISNALNPILTAQVPTGGRALRVACSGSLAAVADEAAGLAVIDVSDPPNARLKYELFLESDAVAVAADGDIGHVLTKAGQIVSIDLPSGAILSNVSLPLTTGAMADVMVSRDYLYALTGNGLYGLSWSDGRLKVQTSLNLSTDNPYHRLFAGGGFLYAARIRGYDTFSLEDPRLPRQVNTGNSQQVFWQQLVSTGSGVGVALVDGAVSLYDLHDPAKNEVFLTSFPMPETPRAVSIFNGLAYIADGDAGLQVVAYQAFDTGGIAPTISLITSFSPASPQLEDGARARVIANAADDVQVRNVEFYLDSTLIETDGNFPFELRFAAPSLTADKTSFKIRAKAVDTGGNATWSDELTVKLTPDTTAPIVTLVSARTTAGAFSSVSAFFDEPLDPASIGPSALTLLAAGPDGVLDTADDVTIAGGQVTMTSQNGVNEIVLHLSNSLPLGLYRVLVSQAIADRSGNHVASPFAHDLRLGVFWINPAGGDWSEPQNWSTGKLPSRADDVVINLPTTAPITHSQDTDVIASLLLNTPFRLAGGILDVRGTIEADARFELYTGTVRHARLTTKNPAAAQITVIPPGTPIIPTAVLDGVTLDAEVTLGEGQFLNVFNDLTVNGILNIRSGAQGAGLYFITGAQTLAGNGQVIFGEGSHNVLSPQFGTLTIGPGLTIRGGNSLLGSAAIINQGNIIAEGARSHAQFVGSGFVNQGAIEVKNGAELTLTGQWTNRGVIRINDGILNLGGRFTTAGLGTIARTAGQVNLIGILDNSGETLVLDATKGSWTLGPQGILRGGNLTTADNQVLDVAEYSVFGSTVLDGVTLDTDLTLKSGVLLYVMNGLTVNKTLTLSGQNGASIYFNGTQTLGGTGRVIFEPAGEHRLTPQGGALTVGPELTIRGGNGSIGERTVPLVNQGTISADVAGASITVLGNPFVDNGKAIELNGGKILINP